jgi:Holliday junction resolvase
LEPLEASPLDLIIQIVLKNKIRLSSHWFLSYHILPPQLLLLVIDLLLNKSPKVRSVGDLPQESELKTEIFQILSKMGLEVISRPAVGVIVPDFLVRFPDQTYAIFEVKGWTSRQQNIARAKQQAKYYRKATGAAHAFLVIRDLKKSFVNEGVVSARDLPFLVNDLAKTRQKKTKVSARLTSLYSIEEVPKIIAAMPFSEEFDDVYFIAMSDAAVSVGATCIRIDKEYFQGDIGQKLKQDIKDSIAMVADISGANPNVLYEVGFSHGVGKPTIHICSTALEELPFSVKTWQTISYGKGQTYALKGKLAKALKEVLKR